MFHLIYPPFNALYILHTPPPKPAFHAGNHQYTTHMVLSGLWDAHTFALKLNTERKWQEFIRT